MIFSFFDSGDDDDMMMMKSEAGRPFLIIENDTSRTRYSARARVYVDVGVWVYLYFSPHVYLDNRCYISCIDILMCIRRTNK